MNGFLLLKRLCLKGNTRSFPVFDEEKRKLEARKEEKKMAIKKKMYETFLQQSVMKIIPCVLWPVTIMFWSGLVWSGLVWSPERAGHFSDHQGTPEWPGVSRPGPAWPRYLRINNKIYISELWPPHNCINNG